MNAPRGQRTECEDSDAPAGNGLPAEVPHPPMPNEDRCEQRLDAWLRWRERKAAARLEATGYGRGPLPYVKYPGAPRWRSIVLTRAETDEIDTAVTAVATLRANRPRPSTSPGPPRSPRPSSGRCCPRSTGCWRRSCLSTTADR